MFPIDSQVHNEDLNTKGSGVSLACRFGQPQRSAHREQHK